MEWIIRRQWGARTRPSPFLSLPDPDPVSMTFDVIEMQDRLFFSSSDRSQPQIEDHEDVEEKKRTKDECLQRFPAQQVPRNLPAFRIRYCNKRNTEQILSFFFSFPKHWRSRHRMRREFNQKGTYTKRSFFTITWWSLQHTCLPYLSCFFFKCGKEERKNLSKLQKKVNHILQKAKISRRGSWLRHTCRLTTITRCCQDFLFFSLVFPCLSFHFLCRFFAYTLLPPPHIHLFVGANVFLLLHNTFFLWMKRKISVWSSVWIQPLGVCECVIYAHVKSELRHPVSLFTHSVSPRDPRSADTV